MSKTKRWLILLLTLAVLALIGWNLADIGEDNTPQANDPSEPTYQSEHTITVVYDPTGKLNYKLLADDVRHFAPQETNWFTKPVLTTFDKNALPTWSIRSDQAMLTNNKMLYLYGNVEVNSLTATSQLERITTDKAQVNLITQDVSSDDEVTLYGTNFTSHGLKMRGNMRDKTARLIDKVTSNYEIQKKPENK
ncbi:LPS export ABC transporter periplasmic protein LptC [Enterobacillus tribolii]|uniref:Lipopolysaccharide export system protein LptC n=1 Tax=Enterobacillus tribolii TaxID=1487935 RepID=A0A370QQF3_9GAMM|nr:LPS export ABC transporter periplasmic protein LptC [Enterobacillus tribolii]MBW7981637.1 LPS export ABC transporter periplasmic protein LptC [Enterobacillus tribolii]RDK91016.1 lipopolysaccharide export system protein LptC [Enterobacillus tribolii]